MKKINGPIEVTVTINGSHPNEDLAIFLALLGELVEKKFPDTDYDVAVNFGNN